MANDYLYQLRLHQRNVVHNFPEAAASEVIEVHRLAKESFGMLDTNAELKRISAKYGIPYKDMETYFDYSSTIEPYQIVLFYYRGMLEEGIACFDSRTNDDLLPKGAVICGFVSRKGAVFEQPPYRNEQQTENAKAITQMALIFMRGWEYSAEDLLRLGAIVF